MLEVISNTSVTNGHCPRVVLRVMLVLSFTFLMICDVACLGPGTPVDAGSVIRGFCKDNPTADIFVIFHGERESVMRAKYASAWEAIEASAVAAEIGDDVKTIPNPRGAIPIARDYCSVVLSGRVESLICYFGPYGFALGQDRASPFSSKNLADFLRVLFEKNGLMQGYDGRVLEHALRIGQGEDVGETPEATDRERGELREEELREREGVTYELKKKAFKKENPSERVALEELKALLKRGGNINEVVDKGHGYTRLHQAALWGYWELTKQLLLAGADVGVRDLGGGTPLHLAAGGAYTQIAALLLLAGANPQARNGEGYTPLLATWYGYGIIESVSMIELLVREGGDPNASDDSGFTALIFAAHDGRSVRVVEWLCEHGADVNKKDKYGRTALHFAGTVEIARILLAHGARLDVRDNSGETPADAARDDERRKEVAEFLVSQAATRPSRNANDSGKNGDKRR